MIKKPPLGLGAGKASEMVRAGVSRLTFATYNLSGRSLHRLAIAHGGAKMA
jgi:hypothetical protein